MGFLLHLLLFITSCFACADETEAIKQQLLAQLPVKLVESAQRLSRQGVTPEPTRVDFVRADLDGSGLFNFLIASYSEDGNGVYLRVFKKDGSELKLVGETEDQDAHGGWGTTIELVDIDGDGIPELDLSATEANGRQIHHEYFKWTGGSLHGLLDPDKIWVADASLEDIDGDGVLELIDGNKVYKYSGTEFTFWKKFDRDPRGVIGPDGKVHLVRAFLKAFYPSSISLDAIKQAQLSKVEEGKIHLVMGDLQDLNGKAMPVEQIDTNTLVLGQSLRPLRFNIRPAEKGDFDQAKSSAGSVLDLEFARRDLLLLLPKLKLTSPLMPGDKIQLKTRGKLLNGTRLSAIASVSIAGE